MSNRRLIASLSCLALVAALSATALGSSAQASGGYLHGKRDFARVFDRNSFTGKPLAHGERVVVEGVSDPSVDITAVQDAIDAVGGAGGGVVVLKGEFDFGDYGRVTIPYDNMTLEGEKRGKRHRTTIRGGAFPVLVGQDLRVADYNVLDKAEIPVQDFVTYWGSADTVVPVSNVVVKNLHFEDPYFVAISITGSTGEIKIKGNRFTDARPINDFFGYDYMAKAIAIWSGYNWDPSCVAGSILIEDNDIRGRYRMAPDDPDARYVGDGGEGYFLRGMDHGVLAVLSDATLTIKDNSIEGVGEHGIYVSGLFGGDMSATIENNVIDNSYVGVPVIPTNENLTESGIDTSAIPGGRIANNTIGVEHPNGYGIANYANESVVIKDNKVHTEDAASAISIQDETYDCVVKDNRITGSGHTGIWLGWPGSASEANTVSDNNLKGFTPTSGYDPFGVGASWGAHIGLYWGASNNTLKDNKFSAVDPDDDDLSNVHFSGPYFALPGATGNALRANKNTKVWDETSDYNPYDRDTYDGDNDIKLGDDH